jgi:hypothetical protein
MRRFATIDDLIIPGEIRILDPEVERKIIEHMEESIRQSIINEAKAIESASKIIIF